MIFILGMDKIVLRVFKTTKMGGPSQSCLRTDKEVLRTRPPKWVNLQRIVSHIYSSLNQDKLVLRIMHRRWLPCHLDHPILF
jgi:hypothetical protein